MKKEDREGLLEWSNISFGHMLKLEDYKEELEVIVKTFLERKDVLLSNLVGQGIFVVLIKVYSEEIGLVKINEIIHSICEHLGEDSQIEITNGIEENVELKDYFNLTLIEV